MSRPKAASTFPLDFDPEEAEEIAEELRAAAEAARAMGSRPAPKPKKR